MNIHAKRLPNGEMEFEKMGPFMIMPPDAGEWIPRPFYMPPQKCEYCARLYAGDEVQCIGCGAPRKKAKGYYRDEWPVMISGGYSQEVFP